MTDKRIPHDFLRNCTTSQALFNVYHEMDRPLASIEGYATLLATVDMPEEKRHEMIGEILNNAEFLKSLSKAINEYLQELRTQS